MKQKQPKSKLTGLDEEDDFDKKSWVLDYMPIGCPHLKGPEAADYRHDACHPRELHWLGQFGYVVDPFKPHVWRLYLSPADHDRLTEVLLDLAMAAKKITGYTLQ